MKVLIVGSRGFIGSNLVHFFRKGGNEVYELESERKYSGNLNPNNPVSSLNTELLYELLNHHKPNICINASGAGSVSDSFTNRQRDFTINVVNVYTLLDAIKETNSKCKFIHLSSAAVYGNANSYQLNETHTVNPQSPYGFHKYLGEKICNLFYVNYQIPSVSLRMFSVYGPGLKRQLFWDMFQKTRQSNRLNLLGSGNEVRDFLYIDDLMNAIRLIIKKADFKGEAINVGSGKSTTIKEAATTYCSVINPGIKIQFCNQLREGDPSAMRGDFGMLHRLGFIPQYDLQTGLKKYNEWLNSLQ